MSTTRHAQATPPRNRPALVAGGGIVTIAALSGLVAVVGPTGLLTGPGSRATVDEVVAGPGAFQLAIATLAVVALLDVVVGWALFRVFASTDRGLARLAGWSRVAYAAVFAVAISQLLGVADLLEGGAGEPSAQARATALAGLADFHAVWQASLALFGVHLVLTGRLAYTSRLVPRPVAVLVGLAGLGYLVDSLGTWLVADYDISIGAITAVGELLLGVWLVARGIRRASQSPHPIPLGQVTARVRTPSST